MMQGDGDASGVSVPTISSTATQGHLQGATGHQLQDACRPEQVSEHWHKQSLLLVKHRLKLSLLLLLLLLNHWQKQSLLLPRSAKTRDRSGFCTTLLHLLLPSTPSLHTYSYSCLMLSIHLIHVLPFARVPLTFIFIVCFIRMCPYQRNLACRILHSVIYN